MTTELTEDQIKSGKISVHPDTSSWEEKEDE